MAGIDLSALLGQLTGPSQGLARLSLTFDPPLPPKYQGQPLTLKVIESKGAQATLQLPDGTTLKAGVNPPLPAGSQLQLTVPRTLPQPAPGSRPLPLPAQLTALPAQSPAQPAPAQPAPPPLPSGPQLPATITLPALTPDFQIPAPTSPTAPATLPAGPIAIQLPANAPPLPPGPVTVTVNSQPDAQGFQRATVTLPTSPGQPTPPAPTLQLNTGVPLPTGTAVTLQPTTSGTAMLLSTPALSGTPVQPPLPATLAALQIILNPGSAAPQLPPNVPIPTRVLTPPPAAPMPGTPVTQILQPAVGQPLTLSSPAGVAAGSIVVITMSPIDPTPAVTRLQPVTPQGQGQTQAQQTLTQGTPLPTAPVTAQPATPPANVPLQGTITQQLPGQQVVLTLTTPGPYQGQTITLSLPQTPPGSPPAAQLPLGTTLNFSLNATGAPTLLSVLVPESYFAHQALTTLGRQWPAFTQALHLLAGTQPQAAQTLTQTMPQLQAFLPTFLPYLDALQRNDPARIFGRQTATLLQALGADAAPDVASLHQLQQQAPDAWRGVLFPYIENPGEDPRMGRFFWRQQRREETEDKPASTSTRFVVELSLSNLGDLQLDGLLQYPELWLKLRRKGSGGLPLTELQSIVNKALTEVGLTGGIAVEEVAKFPINPEAEILATGPASTATSA